MSRKAWIIVLALGAVLGIGFGVKRVSGYRHHRAEFEKRVAGICAQAAHDVYEKRSAANN